MATSPSTLNYFIGKGIVHVKPVDGDDSLYEHIGNCPKFAVSPTHEIMEHFTDEGGLAILDDAHLRQRAVGVSIAAEELTPLNLALALGAQDVGGGIFRVAYQFVQRAVRFTGTNEKGARVKVTLPCVLLEASGDIDLISDSYGALPIQGRALYHETALGSGVRTFMDFVFL